MLTMYVLLFLASLPTSPVALYVLTTLGKAANNCVFLDDDPHIYML